MGSHQRRAKLKQRDIQRQQHQRQQRRSIYRVLTEIGILDLYKKLPKALRNVLPDYIQAAPRLAISREAEGRVEAQRVRQWFTTTLDTPFPSTELFPGSLTGREIHTVLPGIALYCAASKPLAAAADRYGRTLRILERMQEEVAVYSKKGMDIRLLFEVIVQASEASAPDDMIFWIDYSGIASLNAPEFLMKCKAVDRIQLIIEGQRRPVFRCYGLEWPQTAPVPIAWTPATVQAQPDAAVLPVYIQRHAILRFRERLPSHLASFTLLAQSLSSPVVERGRTGEILVAYRSQDFRLGYFVCQVIQGKVVLKTFLFLTMRDTPEGQLIRRRLGLAQKDVDRLDLEKAETFVNSDLRADRELCKIVSECGAGHLFSEHLTNDVCARRVGYAAELRDYLRMPQLKPDPSRAN